MKDKDKKITPVNVNNDLEMINLGIRCPKRSCRDISVWSKTEKERQLWKKYRRFPSPKTNWPSSGRHSAFKAKLIINAGSKTYSYNCSKEDISYLLEKHKPNVVRAFWNGKEISAKILL